MCCAATAWGQDGANAPAGDAVPLPEVVVTSPSPVAKPKPKAASARTAAAERTKKQPVPAAAPAASDPPAIHDSTFVPVTIVEEADIVAQQGATLSDSLAHKPGIAATTFAPGASRPVIRGLDTYRVRVQENGIGTHDAAALSEDHAVPVDPFAAERVEVVRGPATLRYGSQAIGGVVSVENERIPSAIPSRRFRAATMGGYSTVDEGRDGAFKATAGAGMFAVHADGFKRQAEDYDTPAGRQLNTFVDSEGGAVGASIIGRQGFVGIAATHFESLYGIPGADAAEEQSRIDMVQDKLNAKGALRLEGGALQTLRFWFGASDYAHDEIAQEDGARFVGSRFTNEEQEGRVEAQHQPVATAFGRVSGAFGVQLVHRDIRGQSFEGDSLLEPAETSSAAAFLFEELHVTPDLKLQAAGRIEHVGVEGTGLADASAVGLSDVTRSFDPFGLSTGVLYQLPAEVVARLTAQYVERAPDAGELFSKGVHEATGTFEIGNTDLAVEKAQTIEAGFSRATGALQFDASIYHTRYDGFIFKQLTGVGCGATLDSCGLEDELKQVIFTQRDATFYGAELEARYDVMRAWDGVWGVDGQYDFVRARFENGENVPRIPPHRLGGGIYYRDGNWLARLGVLHAFGQDELGVNETATPGYTLLSAEVRYTTKLEANALAVPELTIGVKGENLADNEVRNHVSFKKDEVLEPGASVRVFGAVRLN